MWKFHSGQICLLSKKYQKFLPKIWAKIGPLVWKIEEKILAIPRENFTLAQFENIECSCIYMEPTSKFECPKCQELGEGVEDGRESERRESDESINEMTVRTEVDAGVGAGDPHPR